MRVALFVHCFFPNHFYGTETYTLQLAVALGNLGHDVTVVTGIFQGEPRQPIMITSYEYEGIKVIALDKNYEPHAFIAETYWQDRMRPHLREVLRKISPEIVHVTHLLNHTAVLLEEVKLARIPLIATLTDFFGFCYNNKLESAGGSLCKGPNMMRSNCIACYLRASSGSPVSPSLNGSLRIKALALRMANVSGIATSENSRNVRDIVKRPSVLRKAYQNYDFMIAPTKFLRSAYVANGFDANRIILSRFGVNLQRNFKPRRPAGGPLIVGYIGQIAAHKGVHLLLAAARSVPVGLLNLRIYGPPDQDPSYMRSLRQNAPLGTEFLGTFPSDELSNILRSIDLLAIPSTWYENSPLVLLNSLASHTPVLVSDVPGLTEFITEGQDGWSFKRENIADLTAILQKLASAPSRVREASANTHYDRTTQEMGESVHEIYSEVIQRYAN